MKFEENNLLVLWLEGNLTQSEVSDLSASFDLSNLNQILGTMQEFSLNAQDVLRSWESFDDKVKDLEHIISVSPVLI